MSMHRGPQQLCISKDLKIHEDTLSSDLLISLTHGISTKPLCLLRKMGHGEGLLSLLEVNVLLTNYSVANLFLCIMSLLLSAITIPCPNASVEGSWRLLSMAKDTVEDRNFPFSRAHTCCLFVRVYSFCCSLTFKLIFILRVLYCLTWKQINHNDSGGES